MDWSWLSHFEWIIIELVVLGLLIWQLVSVRRDIRRAKQESNPEPPPSIYDELEE